MERYQTAQMENTREDTVTMTRRLRNIKRRYPSPRVLELAGIAMRVSSLCQIVGRRKWRNFIAQWVPTRLILGLYDKVVKVAGHDQPCCGGFSPMGSDNSLPSNKASVGGVATVTADPTKTGKRVNRHKIGYTF